MPPRLIQLLLALGGDPAPIPLALARLLESRGAARPLPLEPLGSQLLSRTRRLFCHRQAPRLLLLGSALRGELLREPPALAPLRLVGLRRGDGLLQLLLCPRALRGSGEGSLPGGGGAKVECLAAAHTQLQAHSASLQLEPRDNLGRGGGRGDGLGGDR